MPRFGLSSPPGSTWTSPSSSLPFGTSPSPLLSPPPSHPLPHYPPPLSSSSSWPRTPSTVRLTCLSPDGRSVHSLSVHGRELETHTLPLAGTVQEENDDDEIPSMVIRTRLPEHVASALQSTPPMELLCIDVGDGHFGIPLGSALATTSTTTTGTTLKRLPKLCVYSKKDVFVLDIVYSPPRSSSSSSGVQEIPGTCRSVTEPFESILLGNRTSLNILKIRPAPQQSHGYVTMCPPESMAMLTHDTAIHEYALTLHHGGGGSGHGTNRGILTTPLVYGVEPLVDEPMDATTSTLTDFCFLQSNAFSLLSNLSVALLKATGEVFQASPILFRGTVVPHEAVTQSVQYLQAQLDHCDPATPRGRQLRSARQYLLDCFPYPQRHGRGHFVTGHPETKQQHHPINAFDWPAQMQGPILLLPESSDDSIGRATCLEVVPAGPLCGLAVGYDGYQVEFGLISPTLFIPRFQLEHAHDTMQLDQDLKWGTVVTRVDLQDDEESDHHPSCPCLALVRDPIMETVVHYITPTSIKSISTNSLKVEAHRLTAAGGDTTGHRTRGMFSPLSQGRDHPIPVKTTGWSCLQVSLQGGGGGVNPVLLVGAVVSGDVQYGHVLVARLSNGSMIAVNLTETRQIQEMEAMSELQKYETLAIAAAAAAHPDASHTKELQFLHDTPALVDVAQPLMEKTIQGLRAMGKIVGSATPVEQMTPDLLAAAAHIKEQTDKEIMLPLIELYEHIRARKKEIVVMFNNQMSQLKSLREMIAKLKEGEASIAEKLEIITENATSMAGRSATVLQAAHDLQPTITQAEFDYFQELQRLQDRAKQWGEQLDHLRVGALTLIDSADKGKSSCFSEIPDDTHRNLVAMLDGCDAHIKNYTTRVKEQEDIIDELAAFAGWDRDSHGDVRPNQ